MNKLIIVFFISLSMINVVHAKNNDRLQNVKAKYEKAGGSVSGWEIIEANFAKDKQLYKNWMKEIRSKTSELEKIKIAEKFDEQKYTKLATEILVIARKKEKAIIKATTNLYKSISKEDRIAINTATKRTYSKADIKKSGTSAVMKKSDGKK